MAFMYGIIIAITIIIPTIVYVIVNTKRKNTERTCNLNLNNLFCLSILRHNEAHELKLQLLQHLLLFILS